MGFYVYVDNSNVWIEGKFVSAVGKEYASDIVEAHETMASDGNWKIDFGKLISYLTGDLSQIKHAVLYGSKPTDNNSLWRSAEAAGFEVYNPPRNFSNREKKVDTGLTQKINKDLYKESNSDDIFILVVGDADYVPVVESIIEENRTVKVVFWGHAANELQRKANTFINLNSDIDKIAYNF